MGQVFCCFDEKRSYYFNTQKESNTYYGQDEESDSKPVDIEHLRLTGMSTTVIEKQVLFAIEKRPHQLPQPSQVGTNHFRKSYMGTGKGALEEEEVVVTSTKQDGTIRNIMDYEQEQDEKEEAKTIQIETKYREEDQLEEYEYPQGKNDDTENQELADLKNLNEDDIKFSKRGIMEYIDGQFLLENNEQNEKTWDLKLNKTDIKVYIKKSGGSKYNKELPYVKTEISFNAAYSMRKIIETIFNPDHRLKWDSTILDYEETSLATLEKLAIVRYQLNKGALIFNNREFLDKQIRFSDPQNGKYYILFSSVPDGVQTYDKKATPPKTDRAYTIVGVQKIQRREEDGKIVYSMLMQCDLKINITPKLISTFLPSGMQDWMNKCNKYLNNNYDQI